MIQNEPGIGSAPHRPPAPGLRNQQEGSDTMKKNLLSLLLSMGMLLSLSACKEAPPAAADSGGEIETVTLTVWGAEEDEALLQEDVFS